MATTPGLIIELNAKIKFKRAAHRYLLTDIEHITMFTWRTPFDIKTYNNYACGEVELKQATMLEF